jgi:hypothetical protein
MTKATKKEVRAYVTTALEAIESKSIREWATTKHNAPLIEKLALGALNHGTEPKRFATYLVCVAMGF